MSALAPSVLEAESAAPPFGDWRLVTRLWPYARREWRLLALTVALYPLDALAVVAPPYLVQRLLDVAIPSHDLGLVYRIGGLYVGALALEYASGFGAQLTLGLLGQRALLALRRDLFCHAVRLPAAYLDKTPVGRLLTRLTNDIEAVSDLFGSGAIGIIADAINIAAVVGMMLWLDVQLTAYALLATPLLVGLVFGFQRLARRAFRRVRRSLAQVNTYLAEHLAAMATVQVFRQEERTAAEFEQRSDELRDASRAAIVADAALYALVEALGTCAVAGLVWYGAFGLASGAVGAGLLVAFIQYIRRLFVPVRDLSSKWTVLQSALTAGERIFNLADEPLTIAAPAGARSVTRLSHGIEFRDVWFSYRDATDTTMAAEWVLKGLDLHIAKGEHVALVGATGEGKTTVLKLLSRFYDVQRGAVLIDGVDVRALELTSLRRLFAVVLQEVTLFSGSLLDNLTFGARASETAARAAAKAMQIDDVIARLPQGFATEVRGSGANLSAGERQLLAFARALALSPEVLVLDEATSNIDTETEARIQAGLQVLLQARTAIVVAHRLSTVRQMDRIVVIEGGRVAEQGDHDSLMRRGGHYRRLVELQLLPDSDLVKS